MAGVRNRLKRIGALVNCATLAMVLGVPSLATADDVIQIWKVGSPYKGDTPNTLLPPTLIRESNKLGLRLAISAFPAKGFAATFSDAVGRNLVPDMLVFDNFGVMDGIKTALGTFEGNGADPAIRRDLIRVTGAFDELLGPERGWTYLFSTSPNHRAAKALALAAPGCPTASSRDALLGELAPIAIKLGRAYLEDDLVGIQSYEDPERLRTLNPAPQPVKVGMVSPCGLWGNPRLAFALVNASYDAEATIGQKPLLLVFRKLSSQWQLLVAARDPVSTGDFVQGLAAIAARLTREEGGNALPVPATLLSPTGVFPQPRQGERFGSFRWQASPSDNVIAELVEFAYKDDARLFLARQVRPEALGTVSTGSLWGRQIDWTWRVWSISRTGEVTFSDVRAFTN